MANTEATTSNCPWNKGKLVGQKRPLKLNEIWTIRVRLELARNLRDLALFNLAIDSKLRGCDLAREAISNWITCAQLSSSSYLFPSRLEACPHISTRQYARIVNSWVAQIGLDPSAYGTHSLRRTKPTLIYKRTKNLRAVQLLLGHTKLESTVRYLGIEVDDALEIAEQTEI